MTSSQRTIPLLAILALAACAPAGPAGEVATGAAPAGAPRTPRQLLERMRARYDGKWYRTLEFRQLNTIYSSAGEQRSEWLERQRVPKQLRIDFVAPTANGSGILFRSDSQYVFDGGTLAQGMPLLHPLLLLSADAYALPVDSTMAALARLPVDTTLLREDRWEERPVYVVGAAAGDSTSTQFWVDAERMLLLRLVHAQATRNGGKVTTDHRVTYQEAGGFPVPQEILFLRNGRPYLRESYADARADVPLDSTLFDPARWTQGIPAR